MKDIIITREQANDNKEIIDKEIIKLETMISNYPGLHYAVCFHWDPIVNHLDKNVAFFEDNYDAIQWLESKRELYLKLNIPFVLCNR